MLVRMPVCVCVHNGLHAHTCVASECMRIQQRFKHVCAPVYMCVRAGACAREYASMHTPARVCYY